MPGVRLELPILWLNPGWRNVAWHPISALRCLAHEGPPVRPASPGRHDREAVWPWWRANGDRGESLTQAATDRPAPCSQAGAEFGAERPAALRIRVALPQARTPPKGRHRRPPFDASGVSSGVGGAQVPPTVLVEPLPKAARAEGTECVTHPGHRRAQVAQSAVRLSEDCPHHLA